MEQNFFFIFLKINFKLLLLQTTLAHVVPPLVQFLANHPAVNSSHLDTLRYCMNGAAAVSQTDANKLLEKKKSLRILSGTDSLIFNFY